MKRSMSRGVIAGAAAAMMLSLSSWTVAQPPMDQPPDEQATPRQARPQREMRRQREVVTDQAPPQRERTRERDQARDSQPGVAPPNDADRPAPPPSDRPGPPPAAERRQREARPEMLPPSDRALRQQGQPPRLDDRRPGEGRMQRGPQPQRLERLLQRRARLDMRIRQLRARQGGDPEAMPPRLRRGGPMQPGMMGGPQGMLRGPMQGGARRPDPAPRLPQSNPRSPAPQPEPKW